MNDSRRQQGRIRWLRLLVWLVAILVLATAVIGWGALYGSRARLSGERDLAGLQAPVALLRDNQGTVTLQGEHREDIDYALGYVHAQERFFSMDLMRRLSAGELAELVGPAAVDTDLNHRRHRLRTVAAAAYAQLPVEQQRQLQRYAAGVNAGLADLHIKPWEYQLLQTAPQAWRPEDTFLVIAAMYLDLNEDGRNLRELHIANMRDILPGPLVDFLLAKDPDWEAPLQGDLSRPPVIPGPDVFDLRTPVPTASTADASALARAILPALDDRRPGSNSFAIAGKLSDSGAALLANDMHLGLRVPNIWFRVRLRYPDAGAPGGQRDASGVTLPGTPALVVGSNGQIAWGFTNSYGDWQDWFQIRRDPTDPTRYKVPGGWATIEAHDEIIRIKGAPARTLRVEGTRWGPIMSDSDGQATLALSWIGDMPRAYNLNLLGLEHAGSMREALDLAPTLGMPPQNLLVADSQGHIGWTIASNSIPLRENIDPQGFNDGSKDNTGWTGWAPASSYPRIEDPADGRLWTANNRTVDGDALALLGDGGHDLGARAQQIRDDLRARSSFSPGSMLDVQLDNRAVFLDRWQRLLQDALADTQDPQLAQLRQLTATWTHRAAPESVDYRLVRAFREQVYKDVLAPFVARVNARYSGFAWPTSNSSEAAVWALVRDRPIHLLNPKYSDWHALLIDAAKHVTDDLGKQPGGLAARTWGEANRAAIRQPLARVLPGALARWLDMPSDPLPGDANMPRVAAPAFGASERLAVSPGHEAQAILHMPGGQSDNPTSPYYSAGHEDWVNGRPSPLLPGPDRYTLTLRPTR
ncbi:MAG TPA: penicillin acylase family protein [Dyella sp.]|uniref:penicillin acylase family protein n=1 Tax=Dyella sp. TaxID=1869338 RepID=UPI002F947795